jgi:hypothetical protein
MSHRIVFPLIKVRTWGVAASPWGVKEKVSSEL